MAKIFRCKLTVCVSPVNPQLNTHQLFDSRYRESANSPIDEFLLRLQAINKLAPHPQGFDPFQGQLVLLGVVAAVESYFRTLFRRLIALDEICEQHVQDQDVSYGAAIHLAKELLPEAILERLSFVSRSSIVSAMKDLLGITGALSAELETAIRDYVRVCQLRHCAVHRFGKLGIRNAILLGLSEHKTLLEKPLKLDYVALQNSIAISTGLVKALNNFLFNEMLSRIHPSKWNRNYSADRPLFLLYYKLFSDSVSTNRSVQPGKMYHQFLKQRTMFEAGITF